MNDARKLCIEFLVDQLCNSMEFYSEEDWLALSKDDSGDYKPSREALKAIWDAYWELDPKEKLRMCLWAYENNFFKWLEQFNI